MPPVDRSDASRTTRVGTRSVRFDGAWSHDTPVLRTDALAVGERVAGPAIFEQDDATVVLPPGFAATIDRFGDILVTRGA